ncbi:hypothetical protein [Streptomyces sp. NRRL WC-3744]|uniref:hypothetical protein n=1 Tax=Streptomyces sp. NRRL WC-3744 TaxID=1463935 RepID=UPI0004C54142|nr:hypothetical protein [Streptomyces sp. NRRL WC-3744]
MIEAIGDIVVGADVTRPTCTGAEGNKHDLLIDALVYGPRKQREACPPLDMERLAPRKARAAAPRCRA